MVSADTQARARAVSAELRAVREGAGLFDRSERGKLALTGSMAVEFLNGQVTNELLGLGPGEGCYAAFLTHKGKMLGDVRILVVAGPAGDGVELLLDTERVALQSLFDMIRRYKVGYDVELHKRTVECGLLSLIGPESLRVCGALEGGGAADGGDAADGGGAPFAGSSEHAHVAFSLDGIEVRAVRTDVGVDLLCPATDLARAREALIGRGAVRISEEIAECIRVERGRPRYGLDMDENTIPQEAGLNDRAVSFEKGCYVGQETVARLFYRGKPNRHLRGLRLSAPAATGEQLRLDERPVGTLGSVAVSPEHGPIALALVRREAEPGATLAVGEQGVSGSVVELPFVG